MSAEGCILAVFLLRLQYQLYATDMSIACFASASLHCHQRSSVLLKCADSKSPLIFSLRSQLFRSRCYAKVKVRAGYPTYYRLSSDCQHVHFLKMFTLFATFAKASAFLNSQNSYYVYLFCVAEIPKQILSNIF